MTAKTKKGFALRNFRDAGTEQSFVSGDAVDLDPGAYANYEKAGLVGEKKPASKSAEETAPATT